MPKPTDRAVTPKPNPATVDVPTHFAVTPDGAIHVILPRSVVPSGKVVLPPHVASEHAQFPALLAAIDAILDDHLQDGIDGTLPDEPETEKSPAVGL